MDTIVFESRTSYTYVISYTDGVISRIDKIETNRVAYFDYVINADGLPISITEYDAIGTGKFRWVRKLIFEYTNGNITKHIMEADSDGDGIKDQSRVYITEFDNKINPYYGMSITPDRGFTSDLTPFNRNNPTFEKNYAEGKNTDTTFIVSRYTYDGDYPIHQFTESLAGGEWQRTYAYDCK